VTERIRNENFKSNKDKMNVSMALKPTLMIQLNLFPNCVQFQDPHMDQNVYSCNANPGFLKKITIKHTLYYKLANVSNLLHF